MNKSHPQAPRKSPIVNKRSFKYGDYWTVGGKEIPGLTIGYETHGELNEKGDNAVFICPYVSSSAHCAGIYNSEEMFPGYWDNFIGPGKTIDTNRYFVVSSDPISCINVKDPYVITTGPASIDPKTDRPYGMSFPIITLRDQVIVQKALCERLGIRKLQAVIGWSMGAALAVDWGSQFPDYVERVIPICSRGLRSRPYFMALQERQNEAIMSDPAWQNGNYYPGPGPVMGLMNAFKLFVLVGQSPTWAESYGGRRWSRPDSDPLDSFQNNYEIESTLQRIAVMRASVADANSLIYLNRSNHLFAIDERAGGSSKFTRPTLFISESTDVLSAPIYVQDAVRELKKQGTPAYNFDLESGAGHYAGRSHIHKAFNVIQMFMDCTDFKKLELPERAEVLQKVA